MMDDAVSWGDFARYRLAKAREKLKAAEVLLGNGLEADAISRAYYAMFTAARAALALKQIDRVKHSGVISAFNREFVKEGLIDRALGRMLLGAETLRRAADYEERFAPPPGRASEVLAQAQRFVDAVDRLVASWPEPPDRSPS